MIERFIARPIIIVSNVPGRADEHAADDQHVVLELEARRGGREAGERVQQRDHDRHVGAADRQHEEDAEDRRAADERPEQPLVLHARDEREPGRDAGEEERGVHELLARDT